MEKEKMEKDTVSENSKQVVDKVVGRKLKLICKQVWMKNKKVWRIETESEEDFKFLEKIIDRLTLLTYDWTLDVDFIDLQASIKKDRDGFILYKDTRAFDLKGDDVDVSEDELEKFIDMLKETKEELDQECIVKVFEI